MAEGPNPIDFEGWVSVNIDRLGELYTVNHRGNCRYWQACWIEPMKYDN